ncbi:hypothetical protein BWP19_14115 [Stenotrophomonas maltophilia]|nr:hypothetical protein BMR86_01585 [Stenotrophomonas sp. KAs 5-3]OOD12314.1 hypothetical protein BWP19_14115 [Stenotrophomonas maltophilia]
MLQVDRALFGFHRGHHVRHRRLQRWRVPERAAPVRVAAQPQQQQRRLFKSAALVGVVAQLVVRRQLFQRALAPVVPLLRVRTSLQEGFDDAGPGKCGMERGTFVEAPRVGVGALPQGL